MLEDDSPALQKLAKQSKDYREVQRLRALYALALGESVERVALVFDVDESTVYEWVARWRRERGVVDEPRSGRPPALSAEDERELRRLVEDSNPREHGVNASAWDCAELVKYFARQGKRVDENREAPQLRASNALCGLRRSGASLPDFRRHFGRRRARHLAQQPTHLRDPQASAQGIIRFLAPNFFSRPIFKPVSLPNSSTE